MSLMNCFLDWYAQIVQSAKDYIANEVNITSSIEPFELLSMFIEQERLTFFEIDQKTVLSKKKTDWNENLMDYFYKIYVTSTVMSKAKEVIKKNGFKELDTEEYYNMYCI